MKNGAHRHRKVKRLRRALSIPEPHAVGLVEMLFQAAAEHANRGDIGCLDDDEIAEELGWEEHPKELIDALIEVGWADCHPVHRLVLHGWKEHAPDFVKKRIERAGTGWAEDDVAEDEHSGPTTLSDDREDTVGQRQTPAATGRHCQPTKAGQGKTKAGQGQAQHPLPDVPSDPPPKPPTPVPPIASGLASELWAGILAVQPEHKPPSEAHLRGWADAIDRAMRIDQRSPQQIRALFAWLFDPIPPAGSQAEFWAQQIRSGKTLRAKFDRLTAAMQLDRRPNGSRPARPHPVAVAADELRAKFGVAPRSG